ncbi:DUF488 domain-containing protein [soil metagenome]
MVQIKRIYVAPSKEDGYRVLVDRLWPRGVSKERANLDLWLKEIAPSTELRKWFDHDVAKWPEFKTKYRQELRDSEAMTAQLKELASHQTVTLLFAARDEEHNEAVVIRDFLEKCSSVSPNSPTLTG